MDRRHFVIRLSGAAVATTAAATGWGVLAGRERELADGGRWSAVHALPNAGALVRPVPGTRAEFTSLETHYRIDIDTRVPVVHEQRWRLTIDGLVERPLELALGDIRAYEPMHQFVTLACISNPLAGDLISTTRWTGVSLGTLVSRFSVKPSATHLKIRSVDGFFEVVDLEMIMNDPRVMLTYAWDGVPLSAEHGYPLRTYIPDVYGMKQPKWIRAIEAIDHWEPGYWVVRGWDRDAQVRASAVIDNVAVGATVTDPSGLRVVPLGGIAHAGARGISKIELKVDNEEWHEVQLRDPLSQTTWVVWRAEVRVSPGEHTFAVRCYEQDGTPQPTTLHSKRARVS